MTHLRAFASLSLAILLVACGDDSAPTDGGRSDGTLRFDSGGGGGDGGGGDEDGGGGDVDGGGGGDDAGPPGDAGPACGGGVAGSCAEPGTECLCCPAGGPTQLCLCTTACEGNTDCTVPGRQTCNQPSPTEPGICTPAGFGCAWGAVCASPDTLIATPDGERAIADLSPGDLVYSMHRGELVAVPIARVARTPVHHHAVVRVVLSSGRVIEMSAGHPTADGRTFGDLAPGSTLGGIDIVELAMVPYEHAFTHDILPASDTGTYVAAGALVGSTLD